MSMELMQIISAFLQNTYDVLRNVNFPGTNFSIFGLMVISAGFAVACIAYRSIVGLSGSAVGKVTFGGNNRKIKVSKERKNDTK